MDYLESPSLSQSSFVGPLVISLSIVGSVCLVLVAYHFILVKFCVTRTRIRMRRRLWSNSDSFSIPMHESSCEIIRNGVEEDVLKSIPILAYSKCRVDHRDQMAECVVCLSDLEYGDKVRSLPYCGHIFHVPCIDDWLSAHTNCPICRAPIVISSPPPPPLHQHALPPSTPIDHHHHHVGSVIQESPSNHGRRDRVAQNLAQFLEQGDEDGTISTNTDATSKQSSRKLLHSLSLILPMEEGKRQSLIKLKRSLSMDQCFLIINIQRENDINNDHDHDHKVGSSSSSSSSISSFNSSSLKGILMENHRSYREKSLRQTDEVSSRLLTSFSQIRFGQSALPSHDHSLPC